MIKLGLIGYPLGHSLSKEYFERKFSTLGIEGEYAMMPIPEYGVGSMQALLASHSELRGFNVTAPWKRAVMQDLDYISPDAKQLGGVNVVKICKTESGDRYLEGYNTDWKGFLDSIPKQYLKGDAIILGTGGAASAAAYALNTVGMSVSIISRNPKKVENRGIIFPNNCVIRSYDDIPAVISGVTLIVNATPVGTWPNVEKYPDIPYQLLHNGILCFDMVYNPTETEFMKHAKAAGAEAKNGLEMLHRQADLAWEIWNR